MAHLSKPQRNDLTAQCMTSIQHYIATHHLQAGDKLPSLQKWADMLEVSVAVVREAFRALEALGLVDIQHGRGIFVCSLEEVDFMDFLAHQRSLDHFTLEEVIEARAMLELTVLETCIARATEENIEELEHLLQAFAQNPPPIGVDSPLHKQFHQAMLKASGDRLLLSIGMPLLNTFWALGNSGQIQFPNEVQQIDTLAIHAVYVEAIKRRDFSQTRALVDQHLFGLCSELHVFPYAEALHKTEAFPCGAPHQPS